MFLFLLDVILMFASLLIVFLELQFCARILLVLIVVADVVDVSFACTLTVAFCYQADDLIL